MNEVQYAIMENRFFHKDKGESTPEEVYWRVARNWSNNEQEAERFYELFSTGKALPNTPAIANAGRPAMQGSACFVLPINDSLVDGDSSIMQTLSDAAAVQKSGGGTGFSFGRIREKGRQVLSTGRPAPGPVEFLHLYSDAISRITQAGLRNGANMGILPIDHPDIIEFITAKNQEGVIHNFNISVAITDEFMRSPDSKLWGLITQGAWTNGEPGVIFIDTINRTAYHPELIEATNPCGEVPLLPYEACVLGSVNLAAHIKHGHMDYQSLAKTTQTMVQLLDNIIDKQSYPLDRIEQTHKRYRKIGLGVMGYADALIESKMIYGTQPALTAASLWMEFIQRISYDESARLGEMKGYYAGYTTGLPARRNLMCQVIAPTGTISRLAGCSFGIEPHYFRGEYDSSIVGGRFRETNPYSDSPYLRVAAEIAPHEHVATQAAFQKYTDQAVSKTINLPSYATVDDVSDIYRMAYEQGCKGITVYREDSREEVVLQDCASGVCEL